MFYICRTYLDGRHDLWKLEVLKRKHKSSAQSLKFMSNVSSQVVIIIKNINIKNMNVFIPKDYELSKISGIIDLGSITDLQCGILLEVHL